MRWLVLLLLMLLLLLVMRLLPCVLFLTVTCPGVVCIVGVVEVVVVVVLIASLPKSFLWSS